MTFNSLQYAGFLPVVVVLYRLLPHRARQIMLLLASYVFYAAWDWRFLFLLMGTTMVDFNVGRRMELLHTERSRKLLLVASLAANLGSLGFFKYSGFFAESAANLLRQIGFHANPSTLSVVLPVGISFYTFQSLSYTIDVYRRRREAERDPLLFALFVSYFPQLVAGPIERSERLIPQLREVPNQLDLPRMFSGLRLILLGLFKKVAIADAAAIVANKVFTDVPHTGAPMLLVGAYAFAVQIYGDFSGYSDIARGTSRLFNIELMRNFDQPYLSRSITEFWQRWHISLSNWLRDYLYVPLGGNRGSTLRTYRNLILTMVIGGLWHGAAWTFIAWGTAHGLMLAVERMTDLQTDRSSPMSIRNIPRLIITFHVVVLFWVFFRAATIGSAGRYLWRVATVATGGFDSGDAMLVFLLMVALLGIDFLDRNRSVTWPVLAARSFVRGLAYSAAIVAVFVWSGGNVQPFIYFQF